MTDIQTLIYVQMDSDTFFKIISIPHPGEVLLSQLMRA